VIPLRIHRRLPVSSPPAPNQYAISWTGKKRHFKEIHLSSEFPETFPLSDRIKEYIKCKALNRINVTTHSFDDIDMEEMYIKIKKLMYIILKDILQLFMLWQCT